MKRFVVTGGSGFIGSNLVNFLLNKNYLVIFLLFKLTSNNNVLLPLKQNQFRFDLLIFIKVF